MFKERISAKTSVQVFQSPEVLISSYALNKMDILVQENSNEVGWFCTAERSDNVILIKDTLLFDQEVASTTTEITPEGLAKYGEKLLTLSDGMEIWNSIKVWGHSHVKMSVSPSVQDNEQMEAFSEGGHDWFIRIIANKSGELKVDLYDYLIGVIYHDLRWGIIGTQKEEQIKNEINNLYKKLGIIQQENKQKIEEEIKREIKEKVNTKHYTYTQPLWKDRNYYADYIINDYDDVIDITMLYAMFEDKEIQKIGNYESFHKAQTYIQENTTYGYTLTYREILQVWNLSKSEKIKIEREGKQ